MTDMLTDISALLVLSNVNRNSGFGDSAIMQQCTGQCIDSFYALARWLVPWTRMSAETPDKAQCFSN